MGGHPWFYFVPYQSDINIALQDLRRREFKAGRYNPVMWMPPFPVDLNAAPGAQHASIEEAMEDADADGTRSILDMERISDTPDYGAVVPLAEDELLDLFGTGKPTRKMIEDNDDLFERLERGQGVYLIAYQDEEPSEIYFAGYSYD
ncbi:MAG TPA: hypothetical protein VHS05_00255 [Pyrinomonadaceae bacterium]|jgi:hypothetical protein|nr:hypothetical protein [Pyrinomonadaceae bacterium]